MVWPGTGCRETGKLLIVIKSLLIILSYRALSNAIAEEFGVTHASPQVIVVKDGKAVYNNSHMGINYDEIVSLAE